MLQPQRKSIHYLHTINPASRVLHLLRLCAMFLSANKKETDRSASIVRKYLYIPEVSLI